MCATVTDPYKWYTLQYEDYITIIKNLIIYKTHLHPHKKTVTVWLIISSSHKQYYMHRYVYILLKYIRLVSIYLLNLIVSMTLEIKEVARGSRRVISRAWNDQLASHDGTVYFNFSTSPSVRMGHNFHKKRADTKIRFINLPRTFVRNRESHGWQFDLTS